MGLALGIAIDLVTGGTPSAIIVSDFADHGGNTTVVVGGTGTTTVQKTSGIDGYNASAVSGTALSGDFTLRIKHLQNGTTANAYFAGVNSDPLTDDAQTGIDYCFLRAEGASTWQIWESNSQKNLGLADQTYCWIWRRNGVLYYGRGALLSTAQAAPDRSVPTTATLFFDSSLYSVNDKFEVFLTIP